VCYQYSCHVYCCKLQHACSLGEALTNAVGTTRCRHDSLPGGPSIYGGISATSLPSRQVVSPEVRPTQDPMLTWPRQFLMPSEKGTKRLRRRSPSGSSPLLPCMYAQSRLSSHRSCTAHTHTHTRCTHIGWQSLTTTSALASLLHLLVLTCVPPPPSHTHSHTGSASSALSPSTITLLHLIRHTRMQQAVIHHRVLFSTHYAELVPARSAAQSRKALNPSS